MKKLTLIFALALATLTSFAQEKTEGITITVATDNFNNNEGKAMYALHTVDTFMKGPGIQNAEAKIEEGKVTVTFKNVTPGTYAIMLLHDANENQKMDYDASGMPKESYGMSGNDMSFGPPQFDSAKFEVAKEDLELNIRL
ncbi:DUF2141 domain-containing protein [Spongiivirga citrea]|uniref:DUF2141 domain-containing protein n=1 Tax=Spongiivirga citrea TaxID=1481457 RepID=A0A6M0CJA5_9FLAO|nr:DUF2141 domain-containing protein [Spongiivirga citrea]NER16074.1 DUF2141 domain-containing protein [Spongiivirga citrea]